MRLIKWKPEPVKIDNEFDSMINSIFNEEWDLPLEERNNWTPDMDVKETDTSLIIKADVAGLTKKNIQVKVVDQVIVISGEGKEETDKNNEHYYLRERKTNSFKRSFRLPDTVNQDEITASCKDGILHIEIKKNAEVPPMEKAIKIN